MDSSGKKTRVPGQNFLNWFGRIVSVVFTVLKFTAALPGIITFLEKHQNNTILAHLLEAICFLHNVSWGYVVIIICSGLFLATLTFWIRLIEKARVWLKNLDTKLKMKSVQSELDLLLEQERVETTKKKLRELGIFAPSDVTETESKLSEYFLCSNLSAANQLVTRKKYPLYKHLIETSTKYLQISAENLRKRLLDCGVSIPLPYVFLLVNNPHFVLRRKYWPALCTALYAHERYIENGRRFDYHKKWHMCRIIRYHQLRRVDVFLFAPYLNSDLSNLNSISAAKCRNIVQFAEEELAEREKSAHGERNDL